MIEQKVSGSVGGPRHIHHMLRGLRWALSPRLPFFLLGPRMLTTTSPIDGQWGLFGKRSELPDASYSGYEGKEACSRAQCSAVVAVSFSLFSVSK